MLLDKFEQTGDVVFDIKGNNVFITIKQKSRSHGSGTAFS